jgi:Fe-Mn family superoxide dismutase
MKAKILFDTTKFKDEDKDFIDKFVKLLQDKYPLKKDVTIKFLGKQIGTMTTGSRNENSEIKVLVKGRLNRDIMRTLAHEWVHEHQRTILKRPHGPNIGGKNEDEANAFAGRLVKMFEKKYPELESMMYESKGIQDKLNLLTEQILLTEKETIKENLVVEMKKIGIEDLPYSYSSLQKFIDSKTMNVHYNKHYKGYVDKLNKAIKDIKGDMELEEIVKSISKFDTIVRNNAGGAFNHALFWKMLSPKKQVPKGEIYKQIKKDFGNIKKMKDEFNQAAKDRFGSGWAWLYLTKDGDLKIMSLPNQDNPLMNVVKKGGFPLLGLDVWEHAYYLKYQNKRDEYINNFWNVVNWEFVNDLYLLKTKKEKTPINEIAMRASSKVDELCKQSINRNIEDSPYCRLKSLTDELSDQHLVNTLNSSVRILDEFFKRKNIGILPSVIELSLNHQNTINFLKLIADFISDPENQKNKVYKILKRLRNKSDVSDIETLDELLKIIRFTEHFEYEKSIGGTEFFDLKPTRLKLEYRCGDDPKDKIVDLLKKVKSEETTIDILVTGMLKCIYESMEDGSSSLKQDVVSSKDIMDEDGNVIIPAGKGVEIKKMDPLIDSYLSEFFSVFKQSENKVLKEEFLDVYNEVIEKIYQELTNSPISQKFLEDIKTKMNAMIYEGKYVVPSKYIDLYWSNKGQRDCSEKRLSIRFRINPTLTELPGYKFVDSDVLVPHTIKITNPRTEKVVCP